MTGTFKVKAGLAQMAKGGIIMDVTTAEEARVAENAGVSMATGNSIKVLIKIVWLFSSCVDLFLSLKSWTCQLLAISTNIIVVVDKYHVKRVWLTLVWESLSMTFPLGRLSAGRWNNPIKESPWASTIKAFNLVLKGNWEIFFGPFSWSQQYHLSYIWLFSTELWCCRSCCFVLSQACAVMSLERVPADIRKQGGVARMTDPKVQWI